MPAAPRSATTLEGFPGPAEHGKPARLYGRERGGPHWSVRDEPEVPAGLVARQGQCRLRVVRRLRDKAGKVTREVQYERRCTPDELLNYTFTSAELQASILRDLDSNLRDELKRAKSQGLTLETLLNAIRQAWIVTVADHADVFTPLTAFKYFDLAIRPSITMLSHYLKESQGAETAVGNWILGSAQTVADLVKDPILLATIVFWFGDEQGVEALTSAPVDLLTLLTAPETLVLDDEAEGWVRATLFTNDQYPVEDRESNWIAREAGIDKAALDNIWEAMAAIESANVKVTSNPAPGVDDPDLWMRAEEIVAGQLGHQPQGDDYALVTWIYKRAGGTFTAAGPKAVPARKPKAAGNAVDLAWLTLADIDRFLPLAESMGVGTEARSANGFLAAFRKAGGDFGKLSAEWQEKRNRFVALAMGKARRDREVTGKDPWVRDGELTGRALTMILWAYAPVPITDLRQYVAA